MNDARTVMDRVTELAFTGDNEAIKQLYAPDATAETPDEGTLRGNDAIASWFGGFATAFPDASFESAGKHESGDDAIDEGYVIGTNTGPLAMPDGASIPATGRSIRVRGCDVATVKNGVITSHRFYFDQMDMLTQLGLIDQL